MHVLLLLANSHAFRLRTHYFNRLLGLDPTNPQSTFKTQAINQPGTGYPQISWNSIGGRTYTVEYANSLAVPAAFTKVLTVTETNVPAGGEGTQTFVDNYTLTGRPLAAC
jgi:hypothetical protein